MEQKVSQRSDYTFKYNANLGRHGWLRLTPAYSVKLVTQEISHLQEDRVVLDPFSGTGTTGIVSSEQGLRSYLFDINPFLIWLGNAKSKVYSPDEIQDVHVRVQTIFEEMHGVSMDRLWVPNMHNIERWWGDKTLDVLSHLRQKLVDNFGNPKDSECEALPWIVFCRLVIETSSAAFNHVSMSFKDQTPKYCLDSISDLFFDIFDKFSKSAQSALFHKPHFILGDARDLSDLKDKQITDVVTSPPYPNRISYIRELRPYMYWLGFLEEARDAGELDWQAVGGTWGIATSRLTDWEEDLDLLPPELVNVASKIKDSHEKNGILMSNYVLKYFYDMQSHFAKLQKVVKSGGTICYIVGNSSFYGNLVHTEKVLEYFLVNLGFEKVHSEIVRKRNSKKELFEYAVRARV